MSSRVLDGWHCGLVDKLYAKWILLSPNFELTCQSGVWQKASGAGGGVTTSGGVAQLWKAVAGQSISCLTSNTTGYAMVDANGVYYTRMVDADNSSDSGWVVGPYVRTYVAGILRQVSTTLGGVIVTRGGVGCSAKWG